MRNLPTLSKMPLKAGRSKSARLWDNPTRRECNDLPGLIQKVFYEQLEPTNPVQLFYYQLTKSHDFDRFRSLAHDGIGSPTISDAAGNVWNPVFIGSNSGLWWAKSVGVPAGNLVSAGTSASAFDVRSYILKPIRA